MQAGGSYGVNMAEIYLYLDDCYSHKDKLLV